MPQGMWYTIGYIVIMDYCVSCGMGCNARRPEEKNKNEVKCALARLFRQDRNGMPRILQQRSTMMECKELQSPLVSVIMPAYNSAAYITRAIESVLDQTVTDLELIVLDDGSRDDTARIVEAIARRDSRVRLCPNEHNMGTARTRNRGLDMCRGRYAAFLDSDDIWHPDKLEKQLQRIEQTGADLVYASYAIVDMESKKTYADFLVPGTTDLNGLLKQNVIGCSTVLLAPEVRKKYRFSSDFYHEDYVMWLKMLQDGCKVAGVEEVLVDYCYRADSRAGNKLISAKHCWRVYRGYMDFPVWKSAWFMLHYAVAGVKKYRNR